MSATGEPMPSIAELLRRIEAGRAELDHALATAPPMITNGWSPKDHMAHIACWEHSALALLRGEPRYLHLGLDAESYASMDTDAINAHIAATFGQRPLADIRAYYDDIHAELIGFLGGMNDADLHLPYSHYQPNDPPYNDQPVVGWITGNTFEHYEEHIAIIRGEG